MSDLCRLCSAPLRGSRRKWLFGGSGTLPTIFSQALSTHVQRSPPGTAPRSNKVKGCPEDAEFLCGKCCHSLNVYHRYDLVMSRMKELFEKRSTRLLAEREKLSFTLRTIHARAWGLPLPEYPSTDRNAFGYRGSYGDLRSPGFYKSRNNSMSPGYQSSCPNSPFPDRPSSFHGSLGSLSSGTHSKSYQQLLDQDRSRWEHESWWNDKPGGCKRCVKGEKCHSCSSWRVSDANYESVCTVPRKKKHHGEDDDSSVGLQRSKSLGSFGGSCSSKGSLSSLSASSLDSLCFTGEEEPTVFWEPHSPFPSSPPSSLHSPRSVVGEFLKTLKEIKYSPVKTPNRSKIPIRGQRRASTESMDQQPEIHKGSEEVVVVADLGEDWDAFMELGQEVCRSQVSRSHRIQETINWLQTRLKASRGPGNPSSHQGYSSEQQDLIRDLIKGLKFKEELLEDCLTLLLTLPVASDPNEDLITDFVEKLKTREEQIQREGEELAMIKRQRDAEVRRLQEEVKAREEDVARLTKVLRENQDTITALRDLLGEKDFTIQQQEVALDSAVRSAASQDALRLAALREKDSLITAVQGALSSSNQDVEALADSLLSQGLDDLGGSFPGLSAPNPLLSQLQEKGRLLSQAHAESQRRNAQHQRDVQDLLNALNESQTLLQEQLRYCKNQLQESAKEQKTLREALRGKETELRAERQRHNSALCHAQAELLQMQDSAWERDQATKKLLQDAYSRDQTIKKLQEKLNVGMRDTL
ncbi:cingulin-like protein 1 isoform X1 [Hyperolius riggenbachi]|uniref:cingulin-like protein 1 isoform X1 n=1 Tax=Hyperolius riggenbachi TaxID=752182 RepID=UPI0035A27DF6